MRRSTKSIFAEKFAEYEKWVAQGEAFPAVVALGEALCLIAQSSRDQDAFLHELRTRVQPKHLHDAATGAIGRWRRAMHIMSIGTRFDEDEILLVLTLRLEIEAVSNILKIFDIDTEELALTKIDDELREIANSKENKRAFSNAFSLLKKNCGIPIENHWSA